MKTTFKPCKNEKYNNFTDVQLKVYKRFIDLKDSILSIVDKFDDKIINKRFLTALNNCSPCHSLQHIDKEISDFVFDFNSFGDLTILFRGLIDNQRIRQSDYSTSFTIYGNYNKRRRGIYNERLCANEYKEELIQFFNSIEERANTIIDEVEHYDEVSEVYKKAYEMLQSVKKYRYVAHYGSMREEPHLYYMKDVFVF